METINNAFIRKYQKDGKKHKAYFKTVDIYDHLRFHVDGYSFDPLDETKELDLRVDNNPYFDRLIGEYRPGEKQDVMNYRRKTYVAITKRPCFKVINSLKKIVKSDDWLISYKESKSPSKVNESENLETYAEHGLPKRFKSIENWVYTFGLRQLLTDPNAVVYVLPTNPDAKENDYFTPLPFIAHSDNVYDYIEDELVVIKSNETSTFEVRGTDGSKKQYDNGVVYYVFQPNKVYKASQIDLEFNFKVVAILEGDHIGMLAFRSGFGEIKKIIGNEPIYDSFISPMLPDMDKAARENSDLDASVVQHLHPQEWYVSGIECDGCQGNGTIIKDGRPLTCPKCDGIGKKPKSPFTDLVIKPSSFGENPVPTPPAGIVQRDTEIITIQDKRIADHIWSSLSALNMEFLAESPLNQSGRAKEVDRDELNNFVYGVGFHLVENTINPIYERITNLRYGTIVTSDEQRKKMIPSIAIPEKFDLLSENNIIDQLKGLNDSGVDANVISEVQNDYIQKKFSNDAKLRDKLMLIFKLNPFTASQPTEVSDGVLNNTIARRDAVIYEYIEHFVNMAIANDETFIALDFTTQQEVINKMADDKIKELDGQIEEIVPPTPDAE